MIIGKTEFLSQTLENKSMTPWAINTFYFNLKIVPSIMFNKISLNVRKSCVGEQFFAVRAEVNDDDFNFIWKTVWW